LKRKPCGFRSVREIADYTLGGPGRTAPSDKITLAGIGGGGHGQLKSCDKQGGQIVALCDVDDVYAKRSYDLWPQGMLRPKDADPIPKTLDWDLWLGPAPIRPFKNEWPDDYLALHQLKNKNVRKAIYHPWNFRGWWQFGTGALGDMGCRHFNIPKKALKLGHPTRISATSTRVSDETAPLASIVTWEFPAREGMPPLKAVWYDGGIIPPRPSELESGRSLPQ